MIAKNILKAKLAQKPKHACNIYHCQESYNSKFRKYNCFFVIVKTIPLHFRYVNTG